MTAMVIVHPIADFLVVVLPGRSQPAQVVTPNLDTCAWVSSGGMVSLWSCIPLRQQMACLSLAQSS